MKHSEIRFAISVMADMMWNFRHANLITEAQHRSHEYTMTQVERKMRSSRECVDDDRQVDKAMKSLGEMRVLTKRELHVHMNECVQTLTSPLVDVNVHEIGTRMRAIMVAFQGAAGELPPRDFPINKLEWDNALGNLWENIDCVCEMTSDPDYRDHEDLHDAINALRAAWLMWSGQYMYYSEIDVTL